MNIHRTARVFLVVALAFTIVMALSPHPPTLPGNPLDKTQHALAFAVLTALAAVAFPRSGFWSLFALLILFGVSIELFQAIPAIGRDCSVLDVGADAVAIVVAWLVVQAVRRWRRGRR